MDAASDTERREQPAARSSTAPAPALVDLIFLTDDIHTLIVGKPLNTSTELDAAASGREGFVQATEAGCFEVFGEDGRIASVVAEAAGAVACLEAGEHYDEEKGIDTRLTCLSRWALGTEEQTMDRSVEHSIVLCSHFWASF